MNKKRFSKERMAKFFDREGFYIVLFLCVCIVAITAVWVSRNSRNSEKQSTPNSSIVQTPGGTEAEESELPTNNSEFESSDSTDVGGSEVEKVDTVGTVDKSNTSDKGSAGDDKAVETVASGKKVKFASPIADDLTEECFIRPYSPDDLIEYKNVGEYRTHMGVDIKAYEGTEVNAAYGGKVIEVSDYNDKPSGLGWTVKIDHGNGLITVYSNLDENIDVKVGQTVKKGDTIGVVGSSSIYEKDMTAEDDVESHLHFEVLKKGNPDVNLDPMDYLTVEE